MAVDFDLLNRGQSPLQGLNQGLQQGLSMGFQAKRMQMEQDQMAQEQDRQNQLMAMKQEEAEQAKFKGALDLLTNKDMRKLLGKNTQKALLKSAAPGLAKNYGIELPVDQIDVDDSEDEGPLDKLLNLVKMGAPADVIKHQYQMDVLGADEDTRPILESFGKTLPEEKGPDFKQSNALSGDFQNLSKTFKESATAYRRILDSAKDPSAAGDLGLIFGYMKLLDPTSTVREGEFATAQNAGSIPQSIQAAYNKAISGERLAPELRKDFASRARQLYKGQESMQANIERQYRDLATRQNVDPRNVVLDFRTNDNFDEVFPAEVPKFATEEEAEAANLPPGTEVIIGGRRARSQ